MAIDTACETGNTSGQAKGDLVTSEITDAGVLKLALNNPKARNALSQAMMRALHQAICDAGTNPAVRAITLSANGPAFCAGHDLKEMTVHRGDNDGGTQFFTDTMQQCSQLMQAIVACPKPVIAVVHAMATAAGCQLVASCDLAVSGQSAKYCTPGVNIGLFCSTPMVALSRNVSRKRAMEMLLLGEVITAEQAADYGLVNRVVSDETVQEAALELANKIAQKSSQTVSIGKQAFYAQAEMPLAQAYDFAADVMVRNMLADDAEEGIAAFLEKRTPTWRS